MILRLRYPPTPEYAGKLAELIVQIACEKDGEVLDFTPDSLERVDALLSRFRDTGATVDNCTTTVFLFGCYLGEVLVRNCGGTWIDTDDHIKVVDDEMPMFIRMPWGTVCDPLRKPFKFLEQGEQDSLRYFYSVFASDRTKQ